MVEPIGVEPTTS